MAKLKYGIFGPLAGKLGPIVGASWMGIPYVRQAPQKPEVPRARTAAQTANEEKMKFVNLLLMPFHPYVTVGFQNLAIQKTALSAAYSYNFHHAITGAYPDLGVDYSKMMISKGDLPGLNAPVMEFKAPDTLKITWGDDISLTSSFDDQLMLLVYCPQLHLADGFIGGVKRAAKASIFTFDPEMRGKVLEVYLSVTSLSRKKIADSLYMGRITP